VWGDREPEDAPNGAKARYRNEGRGEGAEAVLKLRGAVQLRPTRWQVPRWSSRIVVNMGVRARRRDAS